MPLRSAWIIAVILALSFAAPRCALAQYVRTDSTSYGTVIGPFNRAAADQKAPVWPRLLQDQPGTWALLTFDAGNCDITLVTPHSFSGTALLADSEQIARAAGLPRSNLIVYTPGTHTRAIDIEMNPYLDRSRRFDTRITVPLGKIAAAINAVGLPQPIALAVKTTDASDAALIEGGAKAATPDDYWFLTPSDTPVDSIARLRAHVYWRGWIRTAFFACLPVLFLAVPLSIFFKTRKPAPQISASNPEETQAAYERSMPRWAQTALVSTTCIVLLFAVLPHDHCPDALDFMSNRSQLAIPVFLGGWFALMLIAAWYESLMKRKLAREQGDSTAGKRTPARKIEWTVVAAFIVSSLLTVGTPFVASRLHPSRIYLVAIPITGLLLLIFAARRLVASVRRPAPSPWPEIAGEIAARMDAPVKRVMLSQLPVVNAFANASGTITLTQRLIDELTPDEVRAVIAHEIGHLKSRHPKRRLLVALPAFAVAYGVSLWLSVLLDAHHQHEYARLLRTPLVLLLLLNPLLLIGFSRRARAQEAEADALGARACGDPKVYIRALTRLHDLNHSPHRLRRGDEAISTHPSLDNRISAVRALPEYRGIAWDDDDDDDGGDEGDHEDSARGAHGVAAKQTQSAS